MNIHVGDLVAAERDKFVSIWESVPQYRECSVGLTDVDRFINIVDPEPGSLLIDIGCGTGLAGLKFRDFRLDVKWLDITDAGLDRRVPRSDFMQAAVWDPWVSIRPAYPWADYGFCCALLEYLPIEYVSWAVGRVLSNCETVWFHVATLPGEIDAIVGQTQAIRPYLWWLLRMNSFGNLIEARDLCESALFIVSRKPG